MNSLTTHSNHIIADVACENVRIESAIGRYRLLFHLSFDLKNWQGSGQLQGHVPFVTSLRMMVKLNGAVVGTAFPKEEDFLPPVNPKTPGPVTEQRSFAVDIDQHTLEVIEQERAEQDLTFELEVLGTGAIMALRDKDFQHASSLPEPLGVKPLLFDPKLLKAEIRYQIPQSDWIALLDQMNYACTLLYEIPWLKSNDDNLNEAILHFENARKSFLSSFYTDTVVKVRKSLESACSAIGGEQAMNEVWGKVSNNRKSMKGGERFLLVWASVRHLANQAAHPGKNYSREEARYILGMGALALSLAANAPGVLIETGDSGGDVG